MKLATLLANLPDSDLDRLATEHVRTDDKLTRPQLCNFLESALRSYRFVSEFIINRQPPVFSILEQLLDSPSCSKAAAGFRESVMQETERIAGLIENGEILGRDRQLHLYRRALYEARRNDFGIDTSEAALLAVVRREEGISQVEHFLLEHHRDFREFWDRPEGYDQEINALRWCGILFELNERFVLPEDLTSAIRQALGLDMPIDSMRRLYAYFSNSELADALDANGSRTSGTKEVRLERMILERIQPHMALRSVSLAALKEICRSIEVASAGNKEDLIERVISNFAQGRDQEEPDIPEEAPSVEAHRLTRTQFETMFNVLQHMELSDILRRLPDLRQSGTKDTRIATLWDAQRAETSLLGELMNRQLEEILYRIGLRISGSKDTRIERIIEFFEKSPSEDSGDSKANASSHEPICSVLSADVVSNQIAFQQRASNPQSSLQGWLEELLGAPGLVRCYATEDQNPTKQLKNKLAQAAAAKDGLLTLLLVDRAAFEKAREALVERWVSNDEWSKGVACIALAYPAAEPIIATIVERKKNRFSAAIQALLFPNAEVCSAVGSDVRKPPLSCSNCEVELPSGARFCHNCGERLETENNNPP
jgi:hypothetical protein